MTLDRFLAKHTSEDNASFADLLADMNARRTAKAPWLLLDGTQARSPSCPFHAALARRCWSRGWGSPLHSCTSAVYLCSLKQRGGQGVLQGSSALMD